MKLYEYKEIPRTVPNLTEAFNEVGKDGWELVMKEDECYLFKREIPNYQEKATAINNDRITVDPETGNVKLH